MEFLSVLKNYDPFLEYHLNSATGFQGTSQIIKHDLIKAVSTVVKEEIKIEVQAAKSFSVMLDETLDIQCISQLSTVLCYLNDSKICRWCWDSLVLALTEHLMVYLSTYNR